jgi:TolB-like protein/cytochrome c-type biogenesis protein CcmH/NrfG
MSPQSPSKLKFDIGHVLFIDIVGYSKLLIAEQSDQIQTLREIVRGTEQFKKAEAEGKLLRLPTGDGGALVFRNTLEAPVLCALEISKALRSHPELKVRMGIHSGPVNEITDLNEQANIAGVGINMAQRVMDCGDAGHILVSKRVADDLEEYPQWRSHLTSLGDCEVKHGTRVSVVNLYTDDAGNPSAPQKFSNESAAVAPADSVPRRDSKFPFIAGAALVLLIVGATIWFLSRQKGGPPSGASTSSSTSIGAPIPEKSIAVLPFENLSDDKSAAYFADGVQDEILTKLASIADLKVISRTSTAKYKSKPEDLKTVSQQLRVATVLEGTVQKAADKVRVNVQLIDARADSHLWAKTYDRDIKDVFAVETEVAQEIADSLKAKLSPAEANTVAAAPTKDTAAYDLFLKGEFEYRLVRSSLRPEGYDQAASWYEQAIARDPGFAIAMAHLVICQLNRHWFVENLTDAQLTEIKEMAEHAITLAPDASDTHVALGLYYYFGYRQYEQALAEFAKALQLQPNNSQALEYAGYVHRRLGQWQQCVAELNKALELDPRNADVAGNLGQTYTLMRQWTEAERVSRHALSIDPHDVIGMRALLITLTNSTGDVARALQLLKSFPPDEKIITTSIAGGVVSVTGERAYAFVLARDFEGALKVWDGLSTNEFDERARLVARATIRVLSGDMAAAKRDGEKAVDVIEKRVLERPNELISLRQLSWTYLALGRKADALRAAKEISRLLPPERDALLGVACLGGLAEIEAHTGATADAVAILQRLLSMPAGETVSIARLKIDPVWDPIRNDPGFQQLLTRKELVGPNK